MNFLKLTAVTSTILAGAALPALAGSVTPAPADPVIAVPAPVIPAGVDWTGGYAGAQIGFGDVEVDGDTGSDMLYGLHAGYLYDFGGFVAGAEVEKNWGTVETDGGATMNGLAALKLKAGVDMGSTLLYGTAGVSQSDLSDGVNVYDDESGVFGGLGMDYMISDSMSVGGEALFHKFEDVGGTGDDLSATTLAAKVSFRF